MEITLDKTSECRAELRAVVTADEVQEKKMSILAEYKKHARVAGFRPGKVPTSVLAKHYAKEVTERVHDELVDAVQAKTLEDNPELKVLDFGTLEAHDREDGTCEIISVLTLIPTFELPEYVGIEVKLPSGEVSDEEVQDALQKFAEASATYEPVERAAAKDDMAVIDFATTVEGKPLSEYCERPVGFLGGREGYRIVIGEDRFIPELAEGLVGMSAGETKQIVAKMKDDFYMNEVAGKEVCFECTMKEVQEKRVPEISPELFANVMPDKTMEEVRAEVRKTLETNKAREIEEEKANQISDKLADMLSFDLPDDLVERENENTVQRKIYAAMRKGNLSLVNKDKDELRAEAREETMRSLRVYFALLEIAKRENITATDQEVMGSVAEMAQQSGEKNLRAYVRKLVRENRITAVRLSLITTKVIDLLARQAKVEIVSAEETTPQA